jgi:hypothetical protein
MATDSASTASGDTPPAPAADQSQEVTHVYGLAPAAAGPSPDLAAGARVRRYRIIRELGRGGQGLVLLARDEELRRLVALKTLTVVAAMTPGALHRFHNEGRAVAALRHRNIVQLHEVFEEGGLPFMAMEFVEGRSLLDALRGGTLLRLKLIEVLAQCCDAVGYAHERGLIHRDLKPHNIMLTHEGVPKIMDFGLAKYFSEPGDLSSGTVDGHVVGSPAYMAPEQAAGRRRQVGPRTDVYALGVTLYQCLTGALPHAGETPAATMYSVLHETPESMQKRDPTIGNDLAAICSRAMEKNPSDRYPTANEMAADLRRYLNNEPIRARRSSVVTRVMKGVSRNRELAATVGVACTLMMLALCVLLGLFMRQDAAYVREAARAELKAVAVTATLLFPADEVVAVRGREDEFGAAHNDLVGRLNLLRRRNLRLHSAFILRRSDRTGEFYYVAHADARVGDGGAALRKPGEHFLVPRGSAAPLGFTAPAADEAPVRGLWRTTLSAYAPIADEGGRVVAVLGVEMGVEQFGGEMRRALLRTLAEVGAVGVVLFALMTLYAYLRIRHGRHEAAQDA